MASDDDTAPGKTAAPSSVLILDGDLTGMAALKAALEPLGRRVVHARSGDEALRQAVDSDIGVIVVAVRTTSDDALRVAQAIRQRQGPALTPIVLATAPEGPTGQPEDVVDLGAIDVAMAPTPEELRAMVAAYLDLFTKYQELAARSEQRSQVDRQLDSQRAALRALHAAIRVVASDAPIDVMMPLLAKALADGLGWEVGAYWVAVGNELRCADAWCDPSLAAGPVEAFHRDHPLPPGDGVVRRAWASGTPEWASLLRLEPDDPYARVALDSSLRGAIAVPITVESGRVGVLELLRTTPEPPDAQTVATLTAISVFASRFVESRQTQDEAETLKNEFFALVSHELLTPLTSIIGYLEDLLSGEAGEFNEEQAHDLVIVDRNARRLHRLVDDLMFMAQVEGGKLSLDWASVDLGEIVRDAVEARRASATERGVELVVVTPEVEPVRGDRRRLVQVVDNLVSNAVKFSSGGGRVDVVLQQSGGQAMIVVTDAGLGIPRAEKNLVFERFFRSSLATEREIPGIGLGLSICKAIVEAHCGSIAVESAEGHGSTFTVTLPQSAAQVAASAAPRREGA